MGYTTNFNGEGAADYTGKQKKTGLTGMSLLQDKQSLRQAAMQADLGVADAAKQHAQSLQGLAGQSDMVYDKALQSGRQQIGYGLGQSLAAGSMGQGMAGHAGYGAQLQAGKDAALAGGSLEAQVAKDRLSSKFNMTQAAGEAGVEAAQQHAGALADIAKMGTDQENSRKGMADAQSEMDAIVKSQKGWLNDDEGSMAKQIRQAAAKYADMPDVQQYMLDYADKVESGAIDV